MDGAAYQQWDASGRAVGYAGDPSLVVPVPIRAQSRPPAVAPTHRPQPRADSGSAYPMNERVQYQPSPPARQTISPPAYARPSNDGEDALPNPFVDPSTARPPSRPTYVNTATPPPIPPPPVSPPQTQPAFAAQRAPRTAPAYGTGQSNPYAQAQFAALHENTGMAPTSAPLPTATPQYAAPPYPPPHAQQPPPGAEPYTSYESTTSVQSQAGSLPPSYSTSSLR